MKHPQKYDAIVITSLHPLFRTIIWAAQAISTDETRIAINHLHFTREFKVCKIVATDGRRLHLGTYDPGLFDDDLPEIETGNYAIVSKSSKSIVLTRDDDEEITYPQWRQILPDLPYRERTLNLCRLNVSLIGIHFSRLLATDFVHQACGFGSGFGKDETIPVIVQDHGAGQLIGLRHELGVAYVMPMRFDENGEAPPSEIDATPEFLTKDKKTSNLVDQIETWFETKSEPDNLPNDLRTLIVLAKAALEENPPRGITHIVDHIDEKCGRIGLNSLLRQCKHLLDEDMIRIIKIMAKTKKTSQPSTQDGPDITEENPSEDY